MGLPDLRRLNNYYESWRRPPGPGDPLFERLEAELFGLASLQAEPGALGDMQEATPEPSDLEYDPQLRVVAEWRDRDTLWQDHLDNAVVDVMLESAERGEP